jgi:hypothetical protein
MPTHEGDDAPPRDAQRVMRQAQISPVINRHHADWYRCDACGEEWSERSTWGSYRFWWACPRGCNWDAIPGFADIMREAMRPFLITSQARQWQGTQEGRRRRSIVKSDAVTLEEWSQYVDQLVAEIHAHHQDEPREER